MDSADSGDHLAFTQGIAARLAILSLDRKGRPVPQLMASVAVRCGLLVDLCRGQLLRLAEDGIEVDTQPTGFPPVDRLLNAMEAESGRALSSWLSVREPDLSEMIAALTAARRLRSRSTILKKQRFTPCDREQAQRDLQLEVSQIDATWAPSDACVASIGAMANLTGRLRELSLKVVPPETPTSLPLVVGDCWWILETSIDHLRKVRSEHAFAARVLG